MRTYLDVVDELLDIFTPVRNTGIRKNGRKESALLKLEYEVDKMSEEYIREVGMKCMERIENIRDRIYTARINQIEEAKKSEDKEVRNKIYIELFEEIKIELEKLKEELANEYNQAPEIVAVMVERFLKVYVPLEDKGIPRNKFSACDFADHNRIVYGNLGGNLSRILMWNKFFAMTLCKETLEEFRAEEIENLKFRIHKTQEPKELMNAQKKLLKKAKELKRKTGEKMRAEEEQTTNGKVKREKRKKEECLIEIRDKVKKGLIEALQIDDEQERKSKIWNVFEKEMYIPDQYKRKKAINVIACVLDDVLGGGDNENVDLVCGIFLAVLERGMPPKEEKKGTNPGNSENSGGDER